MEPLQVAGQSSVDAKLSTDLGKAGKAPVVRGARACTVCRAAKMKCVGASEGQPCQRCKRSGSDCIFEKHRRGRKPGSKLSEASKMLRRLEKGLNSAKLKSQANDTPFASESRAGDRFPNNELPPLNLPPDYDQPGFAGSASRSNQDDEEDDIDTEKGDDGLFPAKLIQKERNSTFFKTILNPEPYEPTGSRPTSERSYSLDAPPPKTPSVPTPNSPRPASIVVVQGLNDPITAGIIAESHAGVLMDLFFLRLNPFINLFDPSLHNLNYIRSRCPFLFTTIMMACCKFFDPEHYDQVQQLAQSFAVRAFSENWRRVEVCQAFACLVYWKEPEDQRTWTYIGYACRMAVELGLNRYVGKRTPEETDIQFLERRNRERTYLVLFVHDRSLSTQTGRQWMLPECQLVKHSTTWHDDGGSPPRPEDVIVAAFVQLRRIASETTDLLQPRRGNMDHHADMSTDVILRTCNGRLTQWSETWEHEMRKANGEKFHFAFLNFFRLYVRLFLNSFGIQASMSSTTRASPSLQALSACYTSALENLQIVTREFASISMLRYSQDSITVMTAYSAVFLLRLLRSTNTLSQLSEGAMDEIYGTISKTAEAYQEASLLSPTSSTSVAAHARFLRGLVAQDILRARQHDKERHQQTQNVRTQDSRSQGQYGGPSQPTQYHQPMQDLTDTRLNYSYPSSTSSIAPQSVANHPHMRQPEYSSSEQSRGTVIPGYNAYAGSSAQAPVTPQMAAQVPSQTMQHAAQFSPSAHQYPTNESDANYWRIMFRELGFGEEGGAFPSINSIHGYSTTMPDIGASPPGTMSANAAYQQQQVQDAQISPIVSHQTNGHTSHGGYSQQAQRHYQSYPQQQSYTGHTTQHSGYGGYIGR
ncbi:fungal-specific transcription factor domain-containing protein [Irpex rosettiformis]|uniref:Fungal-specific transcription factor domain-containing protein n=1 Tax=Irpex rosettiformis TaxID=378272 RepID=A0ACB8TXE1_9APHY|nr:fungal-specific transcription factor domain-containing protein [Irpex rosettiformis]